MKAAVTFKLRRKTLPYVLLGFLLPKLSKKDSHNFGHVYIDVNREFNLRPVEIIHIIDL